MLSGDNGVLRQAGNAKNLTEQAQLEEEVDLAYLSYTGQIRETNDLEYYLNKIDNANVEKLAADTWCVTRGNSSVTVSDDGEKMSGKTAIWDGTSVESPKFKDFNWYIETPAQLKFLADFVNNGNKLTSEQETLITKKGYRTSDVKMESTTMVYLMNNLDLGARPGSGSTQEQKWETESNESRKWTPIGTSNALKLLGTFEGNNNTIKGIYVNQTANFAGLFGNSNTIQKLTIADSYIKGGNGTGGVVGALRSGKIENCHNKNTTVILIEGNYHLVGGIVGQNSNGTQGIYNCSNTGTIIGYGINSSYGTCAGGITGQSNSGAGDIYNCSNSGTITSKGKRVGGICGFLPRANVRECVNKGIITGESYNTGGIIGVVNSGAFVEKCYNCGVVNGNQVGGIVGNVSISSTSGEVTVVKCYNKGKIKGDHSGEIIGYFQVEGIKNINKLFYLKNETGLTAIGGESDNETSEIKGVSDDLTYEQFKTWITEQ